MAQRRSGGNEFVLTLLDAIGRLDGGRSRVNIEEMPGSYCSTRVETRLSLNHRGRTEIRPGEFFLARPEQGHGFAGRLGQPRSFDRGFTGMFAAKRRPEIRDNDMNVFSSDVKCAGEFGAMSERVLRPGPDGQFAIGPFGDSRPRFQRRMLN